MGEHHAPARDVALHLSNLVEAGGLLLHRRLQLAGAAQLGLGRGVLVICLGRVPATVKFTCVDVLRQLKFDVLGNLNVSYVWGEVLLLVNLLAEEAHRVAPLLVFVRAGRDARRVRVVSVVPHGDRREMRLRISQ